MSHGEFELIGQLRALLAPSTPASALQVGIGDDAAVLAGDPRALVLSVDTQVEHVHFERTWLDLETIGRRAFVAALSDLAAMGAEPVCALSSLIVPAAQAAQTVPALARGQALAAHDYGCPVVGGNLSAGDALSITTTVVGRAQTLLLRSAARPGQGIFVAGALGAAAAGLHAYQHEREEPELLPLRAAFAQPRARIAEALAAARAGATAAIDLSDGLAQDLAHLAHASGVALALERDALQQLAFPLRPAARVLGVDPMRWVLFGGEDYALVVTADEQPADFTWIGSVREGHGVQLDGAALPSHGHVHFS